MVGQLLFYSYKPSALGLLSDILCNSVSALICLISIFWIPGEVPIQMEKFNQVIRKKFELRACLNIVQENLSLERVLCEEKVFVLSGCSLVHFRKHFVLTVLGTILTYGLLIMNLDLLSYH
ncbi:uncharacterized protein TNIN_43971 [Trichonephila inaurata madagascariensis]|nr:uncharacterized protein TNIN_43971 [Trichonephila inaurata madagascariensis]